MPFLFFFRQLNTLVKERHDSFARLKTTEDLLEALKGENEILKSSFPGTMGTRNTNAHDSKFRPSTSSKDDALLKQE